MITYDHKQLTYPRMTLFVRADHAAGLAQAAVRVIHDLDPNQPVGDIRLLETVFIESVARERLNGIISSAFALTALLLASLGVYGVLAFLVAERTREIGLRMALSAPAFRVLQMVMSHGLRLVAWGVAFGVTGAFIVSRWLESLLFGITAHDPMTFAVVVFLIGSVSVLAILVPARRASKVVPMEALRYE